MIENTHSKIVYQGDGEVRTFAVPFPFLKNADIAATLTKSDGTQSKLTKDVDYTLQVDAQGVAALIFSEAPEQGSALCIRRTQEITQEISLVENARFPSAVIESGFDRIVMAQQNQQEAIQRALKAPVQETPEESQTTLPAAETRKGGVLGWNAEGGMTVYPNPNAALTAAESARQAAGHSAAQAALSENACALSRESSEEMLAQCEELAGAAAEAAGDALLTLDETKSAKDAALNAVAGFAASYAFRGIWNGAAAPTPAQAGDWWLITAAVTFASITWAVNDRALWTGSAWQKLSADDAYRAERAARMESVGNKLSANALELTSGYLTIPGSSAPMAKLPLTYCFTYTKRGAWGNNDHVLSQKMAYARTGYFPNSGFYFYAQANNNRTFLTIHLNSPSVDGDSYSAHQFDLLPLGTHTVCLVIEPYYNDGTTTSHTLPQKVSLFVDGVQWTPQVKAVGYAAEYRHRNTEGTSSTGTSCQYYDDAVPSNLFINAHALDAGNTSYRSNLQISRVAVFNFALPATAAAAASTYSYSVEQYANGEAVPQRLLMGKNLTNAITIEAQPYFTSAGLTMTPTIPAAISQYNFYGATAGAYVHPAVLHLRFSTTLTFGSISGYYTGVIITDAVGGGISGGVAWGFKDGAPLSTVNVGTNKVVSLGQIMTPGIYDIYIVPTSFSVGPYRVGIAMNTNGQTIYPSPSGGTITIEKLECIGAIACLDQPFKGGNQLRDRSPSQLRGVVESQSPDISEPVFYTDKLIWSGLNDTKAVVSSVTNVMPANCKVTLWGKASAAVTVNVTNGAPTPSTLITGANVGTAWTEIGAFFTAAASKLAVLPTAPSNYAGSIQIQTRLEPLA